MLLFRQWIMIIFLFKEVVMRIKRLCEIDYNDRMAEDFEERYEEALDAYENEMERRAEEAYERMMEDKYGY